MFLFPSSSELTFVPKLSKACVANTWIVPYIVCLYRVFAVLCSKPGSELPPNFKKTKLQRRDFCSVKKLKFHRMIFPPSLGTPSSPCVSWTSTATSPPSSSWRLSPGGPWTSTTQSTGSTRRTAGWVKTQWKLLATKSAEKTIQRTLLFWTVKSTLWTCA